MAAEKPDPMVAIAKVLGYKGHGGGRTAVARVEVEAVGKGFQHLPPWRSILLIANAGLTVRHECMCVSAGESPAWEGSLTQ